MSLILDFNKLEFRYSKKRFSDGVMHMIGETKLKMKSTTFYNMKFGLFSKRAIPVKFNIIDELRMLSDIKTDIIRFINDVLRKGGIRRRYYTNEEQSTFYEILNIEILPTNNEVDYFINVNTRLTVWTLVNQIWHVED